MESDSTELVSIKYRMEDKTVEFTLEQRDTASFLVYQQKKEDVLNDLTIGMISNCKIRGVLPFVYAQMDGITYFKYNITGLISLREYLGGVVGKERLLGCLQNLTDTLVNAEEYMLDSTNFLLDTEHIYVDPTNGQTNLLPMPITEVGANLKTFFEKLISGITPDQMEDCSYMAPLRNFFYLNTNFTLPEFKALLFRLKKEENLKKETPGKSAVPLSEKKVETIVPEKRWEEPPVVKPEPVKPAFTIAEAPILNIPSQNEKPLFEIPSIGEKTKEEPKDKSRGWFGFLKKEKQPKTEKPKKEKTDKKKGKKGGFSHMSIPGMDTPLSTLNSAMPVVSPKEAELSEETVLLVPEDTLDATVLMVPYLLCVRTGARFDLTKELMKIGRNAAECDFCISDNPTISKSQPHALISWNSQEARIMDNHSKNHVWLDGVVQEPGVWSEPLQDGCHVRLANEELEFHLSM